MDKIVPAILTNNDEDLKEKLEVLNGLTNLVHIDIMDGKFVPDTSIEIRELAEFKSAFSFSIHLMVENPEKYFEDCSKVGAKEVIVHVESTGNLEGVLNEMQKYDFKKVVALKPETLANVLKAFKGLYDSVLLLSVNPGRQGNQFIPAVLNKANDIEGEVGIDGGVSKENLREVFAYGVDYAVVGSGIWKTDNPKETLLQLQSMVQ